MFYPGPTHPSFPLCRKRKNSGSKPPGGSKRKAKKTDGVQKHIEAEDSDMDEDGVWLAFLLLSSVLMRMVLVC